MAPSDSKRDDGGKKILGIFAKLGIIIGVLSLLFFFVLWALLNPPMSPSDLAHYISDGRPFGASLVYGILFVMGGIVILQVEKMTRQIPPSAGSH